MYTTAHIHPNISSKPSMSATLRVSDPSWTAKGGWTEMGLEREFWRTSVGGKGSRLFSGLFCGGWMEWMEEEGKVFIHRAQTLSIIQGERVGGGNRFDTLQSLRERYVGISKWCFCISREYRKASLDRHVLDDVIESLRPRCAIPRFSFQVSFSLSSACSIPTPLSQISLSPRSVCMVLQCNAPVLFFISYALSDPRRLGVTSTIAIHTILAWSPGRATLLPPWQATGCFDPCESGLSDVSDFVPQSMFVGLAWLESAEHLKRLRHRAEYR